MAYAQSLHYTDQQSSHLSQQQPYSTAYDYAPADHSAGFRGVNRPGPPKQYLNDDGSKGGNFGRNPNTWQEVDGSGYGDNRHHGGRGYNGGGYPPVQQPRLGPLETGQVYSDPRARGLPQSKARTSEVLRHPGGHSQYQPDIHRDAQGYQQHYQPEPNMSNDLSAQASSDDKYSEPKYSRDNRWETAQQYGPSANTDQQYHEPQKFAGHHDQGYVNGYGKQFQVNHAVAPVIPKSDYQEPPRSSQSEPPGMSSKLEADHESKFSHKKPVQTPKSPDTVAWDNPFPTFPMRPKRGLQPSSRSLGDSVAEAKSKDEHRHENYQDSRPRTASSKDSSYTISQPQSIDVGPLKPPTVHDRYSEHSRIWPSTPVDATPSSSYERSRTMPAATPEAAMKPIIRPRPPVQTDWQALGPVVGYYGPEDRGFTPTSPANQSQPKPYGQSRGKSDEKRPYGHAPIQNAMAQHQNQNHNQDGRQLHTPQDSLGDVFDNYRDIPPLQDHRPYIESGQAQYPPHVNEDMPQFNDVVPYSRLTQQHGTTLNNHLQPHQGRHEYTPMLVPAQVSSRRIPQNDIYVKGQASRSRSQPNLKDRRSPIQQQGNGLDFGVPRTSARPPATAPARGNYDLNAHEPLRIFNRQNMPTDREQLPVAQGYPGYVPGLDHSSGDQNFPPSATRPLRVAHQVNRGPEPYRSSPPNEEISESPPMASHDTAQLERYCSLPLQGEQSHPVAARQGHKSSPFDRNMETGAFPNPYQTKRRSPPLQDGRSRDGQLRSTGGRPPAINTTVPPIKAPVNPDALPSHPAPVRAGLMEGSPLNRTQDSDSIRYYSAVPSSMQRSDPSQTLGISPSPESKRDSLPVTRQDLDRLRLVSARNPNDLAAQLVLAKKMVEAVSVLVDERADPRTRSKSREKYIMDAYKIVKKLSGNGYTEANFYLADCYTRGALGLESDTREAFKLYQNAAKAGHAQAAYRVAVCCEIGLEEGGGTSRDAVKAMQWYKRAATLGDTPAMYKMGIISLKGLLGQPRNSKEAIVWLKRAAERADTENPHALHELALLHEMPRGNDGGATDEAYSNKLFTQAAKLGYKFSQYRLGSAYEYGLLGCPVEPRQSIAWYSKAAVQEEHQSELALSGWYLTGSEGILKQSDTEAYLWARKAALAGLAKAEYAMGYFTEVGIGAPANLEDAKRWYWKAASQDFSKARDRLGDLRKGGPMKQKERVSRSNMRKSSEGECIVM